MLIVVAVVMCGCLKTPTGVKTIAEQEQDAIAIASCVTNHWGEDWTILVANCASLGYAVFCDIVSDIEWAIGKSEQTSTAPTAVASVSPAASASAPTRMALSSKAKTGLENPFQDGGVGGALKKSHYATEPAIARRLAFKRGL